MLSAGNLPAESGRGAACWEILFSRRQIFFHLPPGDRTVHSAVVSRKRILVALSFFISKTSATAPSNSMRSPWVRIF
ncbi:hypothetical protein Enr13x_38520 [Stieleria neptunia]|uniref:Uncharacterized protein n=1 Tax=Stieleria neptunia TaxID=2527979 RepID=A0A518HT59_9BACT|nr:hypothetical protein Enr13x_38520 [Stieleria neptunia]